MADQNKIGAPVGANKATEELLEAHAKAVIAAHEHGEGGGFYADLRAAEDAIRAAVAPAQAGTAEMMKCCGRAMSLGINCAEHGFEPAYAQQAAPADLSKLTRYDHRGALMVPDSTGDYFLVSDVRDLFEQHHGMESSK